MHRTGTGYYIDKFTSSENNNPVSALLVKGPLLPLKINRGIPVSGVSDRLPVVTFIIEQE
jgi:hypothetical protein